MKRRVLVISPTPTHPVIAGNRARIDGLISSIQLIGHDVFFLHVKSEKGDTELMQKIWGDKFLSVEYTRPRSRIARLKRRFTGIFNTDTRYTYTIDEWYDDKLDKTLIELSRKFQFDTVIVEYVFFSRALECFSDKVLKIIDTHDAFTNRHRQYLEKNQPPRWYSTSANEEAKGFDRADIVIAIQDKEREIFSRKTKAHVITVGHIASLHQHIGGASHLSQILFVASDNPINVNGIKFFIGEVLPDVIKNIPEAKLVLAGSICDAIENQDGLVKLGRIDDLQPLYEAASVIINPVLFKTGLSIKNIEALAYSRPLVTAPAGADGMEDGIDEAFLVAESPEEFVNAISQILANEDYAKQISTAAGKYAENWNCSVIKQLEEILG